MWLCMCSSAASAVWRRALSSTRAVRCTAEHRGQHVEIVGGRPFKLEGSEGVAQRCGGVLLLAPSQRLLAQRPGGALPPRLGLGLSVPWETLGVGGGTWQA
jgi:hypothetical protein